MYGELGGAFIGIGALIFLIVISWFFYQMGRSFKSIGDYEERITVFEIAILDKIAKKKGIDLRKEIEKETLFSKKHNFRRGLRKEMYEEMFGKENEKKE